MCFSVMHSTYTHCEQKKNGKSKYKKMSWLDLEAYNGYEYSF